MTTLSKKVKRCRLAAPGWNLGYRVVQVLLEWSRLRGGGTEAAGPPDSTYSPQYRAPAADAGSDPTLLL